MIHSPYLDRLTAEQRRELIEKLHHQQNGKCFISGKEIDLDLHYNDLDIDHIVPLNNNGKDDPNNMALTFASENRAKQASDLNVARILSHFKQLADKLMHSENRAPNLTDILNDYCGRSLSLKFVINDDKIKFSFSAIGRTDVISLPIYEDKLSNERYFFTCLPIEYVHHDEFINPRPIGANISKLVSEFYKKNPQLHISLGYIEIPEDGTECDVKLFDGQHKAAAQVMLGVKEIPVRIFINPDKNRLVDTNFNAGTTLKQVAFDKSVQRHLGNTIFRERVEKYQQMTNIASDNFAFSEQTLIDYFKGETKELKRYIADSVKDQITNSPENRLREFIDLGGRGNERPLSYSTVEKTFYSFFVSTTPLRTNIDYRLDEGRNPRELEKKQITRLMNIIADRILIGKFDFELGTFRIENKLQNNAQSINLNHLVAYRMMKEEIVYNWLKFVKDIIISYNAMTGKTDLTRDNLFQDEFDEQLWTNITNYIDNLADLPLWKNIEFSSNIFGGKQPYEFWKTIFETGKTNSGVEVITEPISIQKMIISKGIYTH